MSLREQAIRGVAWSALQNWGSNLVSTVIFLILARLLAPEMFGLMAMAQVFIALVLVFREQGLGVALVQRANLQPEHLDTAFWTNVAGGALLTGLGMAFAGLVAAVFGQPALTGIVRWLSLSLLIGALGSTQQALLRRRLAFKSLAIRTLVGAVAGGAVGVGMALAGCGVWSLVGQSLAGASVGTLVLWRASDWRPSLRFSKRHFTDLFAFGVTVVGIEVVAFLSRRTDHFLIGYFLGPVALGYYSIAYSLLTRMTTTFTGTVSTVALPTFSRLQHHRQRMREAFYTATRLTSYIAFPAFIGMSAIAPELVRGLFGEKWTTSIPVMQVLALMGILYSLFFFNGPVIMACGKPSWVLISRLLRMVANVAGFALAIYWGKGITGVATALVISGYLLAPLPLWMVRRLIDVRIRTYIGGFLAPLICSLIMAGAITGARTLLAGAMGSLWLLAILVLLGTATYSIAILLAAPTVSREALRLLRSALSAAKESA